jgi:hypothetical protein
LAEKLSLASGRVETYGRAVANDAHPGLGKPRPVSFALLCIHALPKDESKVHEGPLLGRARPAREGRRLATRMEEKGRASARP